MDHLGLELAGVILAAVVIFGGTHFESLSHLSFFFPDLVSDFGDLIHAEVSGDLDSPDGHCHDVDGVVVGPAGLGAGVVAVVAVFGVVLFLGFTTTLLGQDKFGGLFALYLGAVVVGVLPFCSEELFRSTLL